MAKDIDPNTIGGRILQLRNRKAEEEKAKGNKEGCTQAVLGDAMGVSADQIRAWEHNKISLNAEKIVALADYFNVSCDYILRGGSKDHLALMNKTGLSNESIEKLEEWNEDFFDLSIDTINTLISDHRLIELIGHYLFNDFSSLDVFKNGKYINVKIGEISGPFMVDPEPLARLIIGIQLKQLREEIRDGKS